MPSEEKIAVIDMGTNTFHLLISNLHGDVVHKEKVAVKLGKGGISDGTITPKAYARALNTIDFFKKTIDSYHVKQIYATATSAIRVAGNGGQLVKDIKKHADIDVQVISGDKEAEYIYYGVRSAIDLGMATSLVMDIGGGSVEFIICNREKIFWKQSFEIGAQRLLDKFHQHDPISEEDIRNIAYFLDESLVPLFEAAEEFDPEILVGSSGTFDTLSEIDNQEKGRTFVADNEKEYSLNMEDYCRIHQEIISRDKEQRLLIPGMSEMRVDMIVVACCMISFILHKLDIKTIRVSTYSLKEGVLDRILAGVKI
ncbi:MAG: phosphatase [Cytophagaceae bacterium]